MSDDIQQYESLLKTFDTLPKLDLSPTFMEICLIDQGAFEVRCSQVLKFFLSPNERHHLGGLFIDSFMKLIGNKDYNTDFTSVEVKTEEPTSEVEKQEEKVKRIDITVIGTNFVIGIENKLDASLNNPLIVYREHLERAYPNKKLFFVVLSPFKRTLDKEKRNMSKSGFVNITYNELFKELEKKHYEEICENSCLVFLKDFIRTIKKKYNIDIMENTSFFLNNWKTIENICGDFDKFKKALLNQFEIPYLDTLADDIKKESWFEQSDICTIESGGGYCVVYFYINDDSKKVGIQCQLSNMSYENNAFSGKLSILIKVWHRKAYNSYKKGLASKFPGIKPIPEKDSIVLYLNNIDCNNHSQIIDQMKIYYEKLKAVVIEKQNVSTK